METAYGLLGGLAEGLKQGLLSYKDAQRYQDQLDEKDRDRKLHQLALALTAKKEGYDLSPAGDITDTELGAKERQAKGILADNTIAENDPASERSKSERSFIQGLLNAQRPGSGNIIPETLPGSFIDKKSLIGDYFKGNLAQTRMENQNANREKSNSLREASLEERRNQNAAQAGQAFDKDPLVVKGKQTIASLQRARDLLEGKEPLTEKNLNLAQQDVINAMAQDNSATEGKISRELITTMQGMWNDLKLKSGKVDDVRKEIPEVIKNISTLTRNVQDQYRSVVGDQADSIHQSFVANDNPKVKQTVKEKLRYYAPEKFSQRYGEDPNSGNQPRNTLIQGQVETKKVGGKTYKKVPTGWQEVAE